MSIYFNIDHLIALDKKIFEWSMIHSNPKWLTILSAGISEIKYILVLFIPFMIFYSIKKPREFFYLLLFILIFASISELAVSTLKAAMGRLRPGVATGLYFKPSSYSFPSAHAWNSMGLFTFLGLWFARRSIFLLLISISILIGLARFFGNYHFLFDVIFGWAGGFLFGWMYFKLLDKFGVIGWSKSEKQKILAPLNQGEKKHSF